MLKKLRDTSNDDGMVLPGDYLIYVEQPNKPVRAYYVAIPRDSLAKEVVAKTDLMEIVGNCILISHGQKVTINLVQWQNALAQTLITKVVIYG